MSDPQDNDDNHWTRPYKNPVVMLAVFVVLSIILLIGASVLGIDHGVLKGMSDVPFARGLITYLFAIITIGIAVALVLSAITGPPPSEASDARFQRGKEILSLLLGVFGTIVGFYFGAETTNAQRLTPLTLSTLDVTPAGPDQNELVVRAVVAGGEAPFRFGIGQNEEDVKLTDVAPAGGWIVKQIATHAPTDGSLDIVHVLVEDATGKQSEQSAPFKVGK